MKELLQFLHQKLEKVKQLRKIEMKKGDAKGL